MQIIKELIHDSTNPVIFGGGNITGIIPAGKYVRIRTQNVASKVLKKYYCKEIS